MAITQTQRILDLLLAGHAPDAVASLLNISTGAVETAAQDLNSAPSGQGGASGGPASITGDLAVTGKFGCNGAAAAAAQAAYTKTYSTAARTIPAATAAAVATTAATNSTPYGYSQAQADAIPVAINALEADVLALKKVVVAVVDDLEAFGLAG